MKLYTWNKNRLFTGINLNRDDDGKKYIVLGEVGNGTYLNKIYADRQNPPKFERNEECDIVYNSSFRKIMLKNNSTKKYIITMTEDRKEEDVGVFIDTYWGTYRNTKGCVSSVEKGKLPNIISSGFCCTLDDFGNNKMYWIEVLIRLTKDTPILILPSGQTRLFYVLYLDENNIPQSVMYRDWRKMISKTKEIDPMELDPNPHTSFVEEHRDKRHPDWSGFEEESEE